MALPKSRPNRRKRFLSFQVTLIRSLRLQLATFVAVVPNHATAYRLESERS